MEDRKLDNNVWDCPNCGLEEYQSEYFKKLRQATRRIRSKYYLR